MAVEEFPSLTFSKKNSPDLLSSCSRQATDGHLNRSSKALRALVGAADFVSRSTVVRGSKNVHSLRGFFGETRAGIGCWQSSGEPVSKLRHWAQAWRSAPHRAHRP